MPAADGLDVPNVRPWPPRLATSDLLLGRLQRGLGSGYLQALETPRRQVERALMRCLVDDPRWDRQVDDRDLYNARLMLTLDIPTGLAADALARTAEPDPSDSHDPPALMVLGPLLRAGRLDAIPVLRSRVDDGPFWSEAARFLFESGRPEAWDGLDVAIARRIRVEDTWDLWWLRPETDEPPIPAWREDGHLAAVWSALEGEARDAKRARARRERKPSPSTSSSALVSRLGGSGNHRVVDRFVRSIRAGSVEDRALIDAALEDADIFIATGAIQVLGELADPIIVKPATRILATIERTQRDRRLRSRIAHALAGLDTSVALPLARTWRHRRDWRSQAAQRILARHATLDDLDWAVAGIVRNGRRSWYICGFTPILARFPGSGPFPTLETIYRRHHHSYCRGELVEALAIADPTFPTTIAFECLSDAEDRAREAAAGAVDLAVTGALDRLRFLADDPLETDDVRLVARKRVDGDGVATPKPHPSDG